MREISRGELRAPGIVVDVDALPEGEKLDVTDYVSAYCVTRSHGVPDALRFVDVADRVEVDAAELRALFDAGEPHRGDEPVRYEPVDDSLTVVICTRDRLDGLRQTLAGLAEQDDGLFAVVVVDNSAAGSVPADIGSGFGLDLRVVHETVPGLSHARNAGLAAVTTELVAWIDDDEVPAPDWIRRIREGFGAPERPVAVSGVMLPAELATQAQVDFERYGGFTKGRGMRSDLLRAGTPSVRDPFYPLPNFGAGGNMTFRTDVLRGVGGFEPRLGAGTLTHGGEETLAFSLVLHRGGSVLFWPAAVTWHYHRRTMPELEKQFFGYSAGLSAYYMSLLLTSPRYLWRVLRLVPRGLAEFRRPQSAEHRSEDVLPADFPPALLQASRRGLLQGAWLYLKERRRQRRRSSGS